MDLPQAVGSRILIPRHDYDLKRKVEARGFWPERGSPRHFVMRRDMPDGMLATVPARLRAGERPVA
jgi:hypothetical protein